MTQEAIILNATNAVNQGLIYSMSNSITLTWQQVTLHYCNVQLLQSMSLTSNRNIEVGWIRGSPELHVRPWVMSRRK